MNADENRWILEFTFDVIRSSVRLALTSDPDRGTTDHEIIIPEIVDLHLERYHDPADPCLGDFSGCSVLRVGDLWQYKIDTGDAVVTFHSRQRADI